MMSACLGQQISGIKSCCFTFIWGRRISARPTVSSTWRSNRPLSLVLLTAPQPACMTALYWPNGFGVRQRKLAHGLTAATTVPITRRNWTRSRNAECYQKAIPNMAVSWNCFDSRKRRKPYLSIEPRGGSVKVFSTKKRSGTNLFSCSCSNR